jgi:hypothetical protein
LIDSRDLGYRLHCCDIVMAEIRNDLAAYKELLAIRMLLRTDHEEIKAKTPATKKFIVYNYW